MTTTISTTTTTFAAATTDALTSLQQQWLGGYRALRTWELDALGKALLALWSVGILSDAVSTILMMRSGLFEEANAVAAFGMGFLGLEGYTLLASLVCVGMMIPTLVRPRKNIYATVAWVCLVLIAVAKVYTGTSNILLALSVLA